MKAFFMFCRDEGINSPEALTRPLAYKFLSRVADEITPNRANVYRKNLLSAWNWAVGLVDGFPQSVCVFEKIRPFPVKKRQRYVPPEEDVIRVIQRTHGQDMVFLLTMYFTGARRGEIFRLLWQDVDLAAGRIRLTDRKGGNGAERERWLCMHPELVKALAWWHEARPCKVENVFMQTQNESSMGLPYRQRLHFMDSLCERAGVKPFGFHAMRHKSAAITFVASGLSAAQALMGHSRATTTDIYVRSAGLYMDQSAIVDALGNSGIGKAAIGLLRQMPLEGETPEAFCTLEHVHSLLQ
jgi:integrase